MRWLHLSDIHLNSRFNHVLSNIIREELPKFIKKQNIVADYLFLTGDYRNSAYMGSPNLVEKLDEQAKNVAEYIAQIAETAQVPREHIYLVSGNHDLSRGEKDKESIKKIEETYPAHRQSLEHSERDYLLRRFEFFDKIVEHLHPEDTEEQKSFHRFFKGEKLDILCLNTALSCYGEEQKRELFIDTISIHEMINNAEKDKPLFVLAHHGLDFLKQIEEVSLVNILKNRRVFYLYGHEHKLSHSFDDDKNMWQIMTGSTKYAEGLVSSFSIGEISGTGELSQLDFYKYDIATHKSWTLYRNYLCQNNSGTLNFFGKDFSDFSPDETRIQLPLMPTTASNDEQRMGTIRTLSELRPRLCRPGKLQKCVVTAIGLPVNAGILIGYALHERQNIQLFFQNKDILFSDMEDKNKICFQESKVRNAMGMNNVANLCVYIQAKSRDDGITAFHNFLNETRMKNICTYSFVNRDTYDENTNLELSAKELARRIAEVYEECKRNSTKSINLHLFYNGFWGLALLLGNQLPTIYSIQLYDYEMSNQRYKKSFLLEPRMFSKK